MEIDSLITQINKKKEILVRGADLLHTTYQRCSTGSLTFDLMLGGGWPLNCLNEIIGVESSGKTTMALKTIATQQAADPSHHTLWVASEDFDFSWAQILGVDPARMTFVTTNIMEEVYEVCIKVMTARATDAVVLDSLPALVPSDENEKTMMEMTVGRGALLTNKFMRKALTATGRSLVEDDRPVLCLVINQWRDRIGVLYGDTRTTPGGKGKNYTYMTRVEVSRKEWLKGKDEQVGQTIQGQTIKNKTAPPRRTGQVDFYFEDHETHLAGEYDTLREIGDVALAYEILERRGAWYHFEGRRWNGKEALITDMRTDQGLRDDLDAAVRRQVLGIEPPTTPSRNKRTIIRAV